MANERYEKVKPLVDKAYTELIDLQSSRTAVGLFYDATSKSLKNFFIKNWIYLTSFLLIILILFFVYKKAISLWITKRKISELELRKKTLKDLLTQTQRDYFNYGKIPESTFHIKTEKLAELIRDIDRQIPLLQEQIVKLSKKKDGRK